MGSLRRIFTTEARRGHGATASRRARVEPDADSAAIAASLSTLCVSVVTSSVLRVGLPGELRALRRSARRRRRRSPDRSSAARRRRRASRACRGRGGRRSPRVRSAWSLTSAEVRRRRRPSRPSRPPCPVGAVAAGAVGRVRRAAALRVARRARRIRAAVRPRGLSRAAPARQHAVARGCRSAASVSVPPADGAEAGHEAVGHAVGGDLLQPVRAGQRQVDADRSAAAPRRACPSAPWQPAQLCAVELVEVDDLRRAAADGRPAVGLAGQRVARGEQTGSTSTVHVRRSARRHVRTRARRADVLTC